MSRTQSSATDKAVKMVQNRRGSIVQAAAKYGIAVSTVYRALHRLNAQAKQQ